MPPDYDIAFEDQVRECFGRVVYTHKTHERMADRSADTLRRYKIVQITLSALTSAGAIGVLVGEELWVEVATVGISFMTLFVAAYLKNFDPGAIAQKHRDAAAKLWNVRECYLSLQICRDCHMKSQLSVGTSYRPYLLPSMKGHLRLTEKPTRRPKDG